MHSPSKQRIRILVTTSHRPSQRVRSFAKDLASILPYAYKVNRGKATLRDLYYDAVGYGAERVVVITVWRGNPGVIKVYKLAEPPEQGLVELAAIYLRGVTLRREIPSSQKVFHTRSLGIDIVSMPVGLHRVAEVLAKAFLAKLVVDDEKLLAHDVVIRLENNSSGLIIEFVCPSTRRPCGPRLRIASVIDIEKGERLP